MSKRSPATTLRGFFCFSSGKFVSGGFLMLELTLQDLILKLGPLSGVRVRKSRYLKGNQVVPDPDGSGFTVSPEVFRNLQDLISETSKEGKHD